jgi:hypothetical protein
MEGKKRKQIVLTQEEKILNEAIDRVYKKYGIDLPAFFRDVHDELILKQQKSCDDANRGRAL